MSRTTITALLCAALAISTNAFISPNTVATCTKKPLPHVVSNSRNRALQTAVNAGKGFGGDTKPTTPKKKEPSKQTSSTSITTDPVDGQIATPQTTVARTEMNEGQRSLDRMRRERAEKRNQELQKIKEVQDTDQMLREQPGAAAIPEKVAQRMGKRMLPFVGLPLFGGMGAFATFWYMATYRNVEYEPALVAATTIAILALSLLGITYSVMSASWDVDREGDFLGADEFQRNLESIKTGLSRSRENAILREEMRNIPSEELERLNQEDKSSKRRKQSFDEKFSEEFKSK